MRLCMRSPNIQELMLQEKEAPHIMMLLSVTECVSPNKGAHIKTMKNIRFFFPLNFFLWRWIFTSYRTTQVAAVILEESVLTRNAYAQCSSVLLLVSLMYI